MQCPSNDNLARLAQGTLDETGVDEIERHLSSCETCRISLAKIETTLNDPLSKRLRQSKIEDDTKFEYIKIPGFRIVKQIGVGGMGTVFEAVDEKAGEIRAIKILHSSRHFDRNSVARFQREKEVVAKLQHPAIVKSFQYNGEKRTSLCIVMERLRGMDLGEYVKKHGPLPVDEARDFIIQTANGLHYAHENGIIHRDIKPSNIFVTELGSIKILDLGLARISETNNNTVNTLTDQIVGTPDFLSPEQAVSPKLIDRRSDIYSLGCAFFYLLTGKAPFSEQETVGGKIAAHARDIAPNIRKLRSDVSSEIAAVLKKMLEKKPEKRFQTAVEVAEALTAKPMTGFLNRYWIVLCVLLLASICAASVLFSNGKHKKNNHSNVTPAPTVFAPALEIPPAEAPFQDRKIRLTYQLDENGKATYRLENQADAKEVPFDGEPFEIPRHPKTKARRNAEGIIQLRYDFADFDETDPYLERNYDVRLEPPYNVLKNGNMGNMLVHAKSAPLFFQCDIDQWTGSPAYVAVEENTLHEGPDTLCLPNALRQVLPREYAFVTTLRRKGDRDNWAPLFDEEIFQLPYEKSYELPPDVRFEKLLKFYLCQPNKAHFPIGDLKIRRAEFRGRLIEKDIAIQYATALKHDTVTEKKSKNDSYRVEGRKILGPDGKPVFFRGFAQNFYAKTEPEDAKDMKEMGVKYARYIFVVDPPPNKSLSEQKWKFDKMFHEVDKVLTREGIDVIVSFEYEDHPVIEPIDQRERPWNDDATNEHFLTIWKRIIDQLKYNPRIIAWHLYGQPDTRDKVNLNRWYKTVIPAIREMDPIRPIVVSGIDWASFVHLDDNYLVDDPNVIYSVNVYEYSRFSSSEVIENEISKIFHFRDRNNIPIICGQWGYVNYDSANTRRMKELITIFESNDLPWFNHTWVGPATARDSETSTNKTMPDRYELFRDAFSRPEKFNRNSPEFGKE